MSRTASLQEQEYLKMVHRKYNINPGTNCGKCKSGLCGQCFWNGISIRPELSVVCHVHDFVFKKLRTICLSKTTEMCEVIKYKLENSQTKARCGLSCIWHDYFFGMLVPLGLKYNCMFELDREDNEEKKQ